MLQNPTTSGYDPFDPRYKPWRELPHVINIERSLPPLLTTTIKRQQNSDMKSTDPWVPTMRQPIRKKVKKKSKTVKAEGAECQNRDQTVEHIKEENTSTKTYLNIPGIVCFKGQPFAKIKNNCIVMPVPSQPCPVVENTNGKRINMNLSIQSLIYPAAPIFNDSLHSYKRYLFDSVLIFDCRQ
jgi:hypothetical protein